MSFCTSSKPVNLLGFHYHGDSRLIRMATTCLPLGRSMAIRFVLLASLTIACSADSEPKCPTNSGEPASCRVPHRPVSEMTPDEVKTELASIMKSTGFERPTRSAVDPSRPWRNGPPNYDVADLLYLRGKSRNHAPGSLEFVIENFIKEWEMEVTHLKPEDWTLVEHDVFTISANGGRVFNLTDNAKVGTYNTLLDAVDPSMYNARKQTWETSHEIFGGAFKGGFPLEILEVFSGPPKATWSFRHWATFDGSYKGRQGDGKVYNMFGLGVAELNAKGHIRNVEIFFKPEAWLRALQGDIGPDALEQGRSIIGDGCPIMGAGKK